VTSMFGSTSPSPWASSILIGPRAERSEGETLVSLFDAAVARWPESVAVECRNDTMTFAELQLRVLGAVTALERLKVRRGSVVGVFMDRSPAMVVALLAVLRTGAAYLPLGTDLPLARLERQLDDVSPALVIADDSRVADLEHVAPVAPASVLRERYAGRDENAATPDDTAYLIYTSGSTGEPKGVLVEHDAVVNLITWMIGEFGFGPGRRILQKSPLTFDVSVWELFAPLVSGATLVLAEPGRQNDPNYLCDVLRQHRITDLPIVPTVLSTLIRMPEFAACRELRHVYSGGEQLTAALVRDFSAVQTSALHNLYGPTEATVQAVTWTCQPADNEVQPPIGRPIANMSAVIVDAAGEPLPVGQVGELWLAGSGLARGYLNRKDLGTAFVETSIAGLPESRAYRTGDLARVRDDGLLEYVGRADRQVKIGGIRTELGEVETLLEAVPGVVAGHVVLSSEMPDVPARLTAYVAFADELPTLSEFRREVSQVAPTHMVPAVVFGAVGAPLTRHGKMDKEALTGRATRLRDPDPVATSSSTDASGTSGVELVLVEIVSQLLDVTSLDRLSNFYSLGGDSILALQLLTRARERNIELRLPDVRRSASIAELASRALSLEPRSEPRRQGPECGPLLPIQRRATTYNLPRADQWAMPLLLRWKAGGDVDRMALQRAINHVVARHEALRAGVDLGAGRQHIVASEKEANCQLLEREGDINDESLIMSVLDEACAGLAVREGQVVRAALIHGSTGAMLVLALHHFVVDGVSLRILAEDLDLAYARATTPENEPTLPGQTASLFEWSIAWQSVSGSPELASAQTYWAERFSPPEAAESVAATRHSDVATKRMTFTTDDTAEFLGVAPRLLDARPDEMLLTAFGAAWMAFTGSESFYVDVEGHGRDPIHGLPDISRTVGWFTCIYPFHVTPRTNVPLETLLRTVRDQLRSIPVRATGYGLLRYAAQGQVTDRRIPKPQVKFNYLGRFSGTSHEFFDFADVLVPLRSAPENEIGYRLDVSVAVINDRLVADVQYGSGDGGGRHARYVTDLFRKNVEKLILESRARGTAARDLPVGGTDLGLPEPGLKALSRSLQNSQAALDVAPESVRLLSGTQAGIFVDTIVNRGDEYLIQTVRRFRGRLDPETVRRAIDVVTARHPALRSLVLWEGLSRPVQVVLEPYPAEYGYITDATSSPDALGDFLAMDRAAHFEMGGHPLVRWTLLDVRDGSALVCTQHHLFLDGVGAEVVWRDLARTYDDLFLGRPLDARLPISSLTSHMPERPRNVDFWRSRMTDVQRIPATRSEGGETPSPVRVALSDSRMAKLDTSARRMGASPVAFLYAAWCLTLAAAMGQRSVCIGTVFSGLGSADDIGLFVGNNITTLPLHVVVMDGAEKADVVRSIQAELAELSDHQSTSLGEVKAWCGVPPQEELFTSVVVSEQFGIEQPASWGTAKVVSTSTEEVSVYPITVVLRPDQSEVLLRGNAAVDREQLVKFADQLQAAIGELTENNSQTVTAQTFERIQRA